MSEYSYKWSWDDEYQKFTVNDRKVWVPLCVKINDVEVPIPEEKRVELAAAYVDFARKVRECFGVQKVIITGPIFGFEGEETISEFLLYLNSPAMVLFENTLEDIGKSPKQYETRIDRLLSKMNLFSIDPASSNVTGFFERAYPLDNGVESVGGVFENFSQSVRETHEPKSFLSLDEMALILLELKKTAKEDLEKAGIDTVESNLTEYLHLSYLKDFQAFKDAIKGMPYLKSPEEDKSSITHMISIGLTYERIYAMSVLDIYPKDEEALKSFLALPYQWMLKAFVN